MSETSDLEPLRPEEFAARSSVSRETMTRLAAYVGLLREWNAKQNLVSANSLRDVWRRHVWDSAQLADLVPRGAKTLADLGSGAGFPGLVLAELLRGRTSVTLYEATRKKAEFLAAAAGCMGLDVRVCNQRVEAAKPKEFDVVTARALAPLDELLSYAHPFTHKSTVCLFLKGQSVASELTKGSKSWSMLVKRHRSATDPGGVILEIQRLVPFAGKSSRKVR